MSNHMAMILGDIVGTSGAILLFLLEIAGIMLMLYTPYLVNKIVFRKKKGLL